MPRKSSKLSVSEINAATPDAAPSLTPEQRAERMQLIHAGFFEGTCGRCQIARRKQHDPLVTYDGSPYKHACAVCLRDRTVERARKAPRIAQETRQPTPRRKGVIGYLTPDPEDSHGPNA